LEKTKKIKKKIGFSRTHFSGFFLAVLQNAGHSMLSGQGLPNRFEQDLERGLE